MKCLTKDEISRWLREHGHVEHPRYNEARLPSLLRVAFYPPVKLVGIEKFVRLFLDEIVLDGELLVQFTDWMFFDGSQQFTFESWWKSANEMRSIEEVPGCVVSFEDREQAIALFSVTAGFQWCTYIYSSRDQIVLFNWEGVIFDVWTTSPNKMAQIRGFIKNYQLKFVEDD